MMALPTGTVTFLFTDIEGSTRLLQAGEKAYRAALARHDAIIRQAVAAHAGVVFQTRGDGFCAVFTAPTQAVQAALVAQRALWCERWGDAGQVKARMGVHTGAVDLQGEEYFGATLHRVARLMDSAHGGQVVLSAATTALVAGELPPDIWLKDLGEHRFRDMAQTERIRQLCGPDLPTDFPPLRTASAAPSNLPIQATAFIGREQQRRGIAETLSRPDTRLVTLTGPGGTGKTRLGLQVASDLLDRFHDGVFFVPLASISDPDLVLSAIALALDVRETAGRPILASLVDTLASKSLLLVLDNFEQVLDAAPPVASLLHAAPGLKVLVTSRSILRLYGEHEHPVPPLTLPDRRANPTAEHLVQFEAVRLFVDRARAARPDLALTDENAAVIAEICQRLDGLPLAIELAAARIRALPPRALLERMERRLPLLTGGARDLPARQRTLRDAIAWSYDLLEPDEQILFRRLAVFRGCTLESAEAVCAGDPPRPGASSVALPPLNIDVLDGVESLVEKSLLGREDTTDGQSWYVMLETVHEYALERLEASGEQSAVQRRQILGCLRLGEETETKIYGPEQTGWLARLDREHDNLRAALTWCEEQGYAEPALRLAGSIWGFWSTRGHVREGYERLVSLLRRFPYRPARARLHCQTLYATATLASILGDYANARELHEHGLTIRRDLNDQPDVFSVLEGLAMVACMQGNYLEARTHMEEALAIAHRLGIGPMQGSSLVGMATILLDLGELAQARAHCEQAVQLLRTLPNRRQLSVAILALAGIALEESKVEEAYALANESLAIWRQAGDQRSVALAQANLGSIALVRGDRDAARAHLNEGLASFHEVGDTAGVAMVLERFVDLAFTTGQQWEALRLAGAAAALRDRAGVPLSAKGLEKVQARLLPARTALGAEKADAAWCAGHALDEQAAVATALALTTACVAANTTTSMSATADLGATSVLSRREQEVAALIATGLTNRQIADQLVITEGTAANHVNHILSKLGFSSRAQVAAWAATSGLS